MVKNQEQIVNIVGRNLKQARLDKKYTREQLAERMDISVRYLTAIENETRRPGLEVLYRLIHSLGISADVIFYSDNGKDTDDQHIMYLYQNCSDRDKVLIRNLLDSMSDHSE